MILKERMIICKLDQSVSQSPGGFPFFISEISIIGLPSSFYFSAISSASAWDWAANSAALISVSPSRLTLIQTGYHNRDLCPSTLYSCPGPFSFSLLRSTKATPKLFLLAMILPKFLPLPSLISCPLRSMSKPRSISLSGEKSSI